MSRQAVALEIHAELTEAIEAGRISRSLLASAKALTDRLSRPVMIGIAGLPGSGKSELLNLLAGSTVLSGKVRMPTTELSYGDSPATICTLPDGSTVSFDHADLAEIAALSPLFVQIRLPLPALQRVSLLEVVAGENQNEQQRSLKWMAKRCDIAIWCTQVFTASEQSLWYGVPDATKDHSFLLITKADMMQAGGGLQSNLEEIRASSADQFTHILPIETTRAIAARRPDGGVDKERMRDSGGLTLVSAIVRQVDMGLQSAIDHADILMRDFRATDKPTGTQPAKTAEPAAAHTPDPAKTTPDAGAAMAGPAQDIKAADPPKPLSPETVKAYEHAVSHLTEQGRKIARDIAKAGSEAPAIVMAGAVDNVQWLTDYLDETDAPDTAVLDRSREIALDASDLVQLMQMEKRDSASIEAISMVLQLKRELQQELAA